MGIQAIVDENMNNGYLYPCDVIERVNSLAEHFGYQGVSPSFANYAKLSARGMLVHHDTMVGYNQKKGIGGVIFLGFRLGNYFLIEDSQ